MLERNKDEVQLQQNGLKAQQNKIAEIHKRGLPSYVVVKNKIDVICIQSLIRLKLNDVDKVVNNILLLLIFYYYYVISG